MGGYGIERYPAGAPLPRHRHAEPYMAIVLEGGYREAGDAGRTDAAPGDVLLHAAFEAHRDEFDRRGAVVLNLPLEPGRRSGFGRVDDIDQIIRLAERDPWLASRHAQAGMAAGKLPLGDWPDLLADALRANPGLRIAEWADRHGLAPASVSRGFAQAFGVSPKRFRLEARVRRAVQRLPHWQGSLASFAAELGFADQAHLSREVGAMTGLSPGAIKAKSVQGGEIRPR